MKIHGNNPVEGQDLYGKVNDLNKKETAGKSTDVEKSARKSLMSFRISEQTG